ncbi:hypothetical protein FSP39_017563 [Pinctada imbricata]|uniref:Uncharacterized protein n=1 Tax=Pinctada imbricata TaxID=66713 RepID=A0AA88YMU8_PINIB|nr:hypothetical protein FSP39_017563 [Pinctada imbricata]
MSLRRFLTRRGLPDETIKRMEEDKEEQSDNYTIDDLQQLLRKELDFSIGISQSLEDEQNQTSTADRKFDFVENIDDLHNQLIEEIRESNHFFTYDTCKSVGDVVNIESSDDDDDDCDFVRFEVIDNRLQQVSKRKLDQNPLDELFELSNLKFKKSD